MEFETTDSATVLVGMPGFVVRAVTEDDAGELWVLVETTATVVACRSCGTRARSKGRQPVLVRDVPSGGRPVVLVWKKRRWRCPETDCEVRTWTEHSEAIGARAVLTDRARRAICRQVGAQGRSVAEVAGDFGVCWDTAMGAVREHGQPLVDDHERIRPVTALGVDETSWLKPNAYHRALWATGLVDVRRGELVDVIEGRNADILRDWLSDRHTDWLAAIAVVAIDPYEAYRSGLSPHLDHATVVADPFHIVRLANNAVDGARRRCQKEETGRRGRKGDPLYGIRRLLLTGAERLTDPGRARLEAGLAAGDPNGDVLACWVAKEHLREVYAVDDTAEAERLLDTVIAECWNSPVEELGTLAKTLRHWREPILNHHRTGVSNGPTEAMNLLIKKIKRVGRGFTNFDNYRLRLLLHCGVQWDTHRTASIRGRKPRLAA